MGSITFKNVGQGDSIIIEWDVNGRKKIGIIDCNIIDGKNPVYDYIVNNSITEIEFMVLSHFHYDHFSGFSEIFNRCLSKNIIINWFFHTLSETSFDILKKVFTAKKFEKAFIDFFDSLDLLGNLLVNDINVNYQTNPLPLSPTKILSFLAPNIKTGQLMAKQVKRKVIKKTFTYSDINKFSTIACLFDSQTNESVIISSDATKDNFKKIFSKINTPVRLIQIPHHGSIGNIYHDFWINLKRTANCTAVFSVGDEPKDKLPDIETVEFVDHLKYKIHATNCVYGIKDYYTISSGPTTPINVKSQYLNIFSSKIRTVCLNHTVIPPNLHGDQVFPF